MTYKPHNLTPSNKMSILATKQRFNLASRDDAFTCNEAALDLKLIQRSIFSRRKKSTYAPIQCSAPYATNCVLAMSCKPNLCLDIRLVTPNKLLELKKVGCELDLRLEEVLSIQVVLRGVGGVLLDVQTDSGAR